MPTILQDTIKTATLSPEQKLLREAKDRYKICEEQGSDIRKAALLDLNFVDGQQWDSQIQQSRQQAKRPTLTVNKLRVYINQVINDIRSNRPQIKIRPVNDGVPESTARVCNGLIRHITNNGDYKGAIDNATKYAASCGMGYFRVITEFCNDESFDQEFRIKIIDNPFTVYFPFSLIRELDFSDAPYAFIRTLMSKDDFREEYPDANDMDHWQSATIGDAHWTEQNELWLAEYFKVIKEPATLYLLSNGQTSFEEPNILSGLTVVNKRQTVRKKVMWYLLSEHTILDQEELVFDSIPIVPVLGQDYVIDNKKRYYSLIRDAVDPQRLYNFWKSSEAELLMLTPKAVWMGAKGAFDGLENQYKEANAKPMAFLEYNPSTNLAIPTAPPQRVDPPQISPAFITAAQGASDDIRATTGLFQQSMGQGGAEKSGKAITALQRQGDTANYHFFESVNVATRRLGRLLIRGIPKIYDTARTIRIVGEDGTEDVAKINQAYHDEKKGIDILYDLTVGEYDVVVDTSIAYETKRMESLDILAQFITSYPPAAQVVGDLLTKNLDIPEAREMADRLRRMVPPEILKDPEETDGGIDEAQVRAMVADLQKMQQQLQMAGEERGQMIAFIKSLQEELKSKREENQVKLATAQMKTEAEIHKANIGMKQEMIKQHGAIQTHNVDAAINMHHTSLTMAQKEKELNRPSPTSKTSGKGAKNE